MDLICGQDLEKLGIACPGGWNMLAFWDHLDSCEACREAQASLNEQLKELISGGGKHGGA